MRIVLMHTPTQFPFEDPTGQVYLPPTINTRVSVWRRPADITAGQEQQPWTIVSPKRFETFPQFHLQSESEKAFLRSKNMRVKPKMIVRLLIVLTMHVYSLTHGRKHTTASSGPTSISSVAMFVRGLKNRQTH